MTGHGKGRSFDKTFTAHTCLILLLSSCFSGCSGLTAPTMPGTPRTLEELEVPSGEHRLQVLITYNGIISTHAAIRLEHSRRDTVFWDPAGLYGQAETDEPGSPVVNDVQRLNDVIWERAPTLPGYWSFAEATGDTAMEVLEWRLSGAQTETVYEALVTGAQSSGSRGFATATSEPFCTIAVSDFLRRYGRGIVQVPDSYLFPTSLAEQLRGQTRPHFNLLSDRVTHGILTGC